MIVVGKKLKEKKMFEICVLKRELKELGFFFVSCCVVIKFLCFRKESVFKRWLFFIVFCVVCFYLINYVCCRCVIKACNSILNSISNAASF